MSSLPRHSRERRTELLAATVYLGTLLVLILFLRFRIYGTFRFSGSSAYEVAVFVGATFLLRSSICLFMGRRLGDPIALVGALMIMAPFPTGRIQRLHFQFMAHIQLARCGTVPRRVFRRLVNDSLHWTAGCHDSFLRIEELAKE